MQVPCRPPANIKKLVLPASLSLSSCLIPSGVHTRPACLAPCSHPAVLRHLRSSGERMLLLGHRSKWETVVVPDEVEDVVVVLESLPYTVRVALDAAAAQGGQPPCQCNRYTCSPFVGAEIQCGLLPCPHVFFDTLSRCRAILLAFATGSVHHA